MAVMSATVGVGRFMAWDGDCLFIGRHHTAVPAHAHQAIQLVLGRNAPHLVRAGDEAPWIEYSAAVIASRQPHGIDVTKADYGIVVFVEPETREGRAIAERHIREELRKLEAPRSKRQLAICSIPGSAKKANTPFRWPHDRWWAC
jgi:hypothetical protein